MFALEIGVAYRSFELTISDIFQPYRIVLNNLPIYINNIYFGCFALFSYFKTFSCSQGWWTGGWLENPILMKAKSSNQTWTKGLSKIALKNGRSLVKLFWYIKNTCESFVVILRVLNSLGQIRTPIISHTFFKWLDPRRCLDPFNEFSLFFSDLQLVFLCLLILKKECVG